MNNNGDQNKFIVDNLMVDGTKQENNTSKKIYEEEKKIDGNPYELTGNDEKYFKLFIGDNYDAIAKKRFNIPAFLLCGVYLLYRKCYIIGIAWIIVNLIFLVLLPILDVNFMLVLAIILISHICCGCFANSSYLQYVGLRIVDYRMIDPNNLKKLLINNGGTNLLVALIPFLALLLIYSVVIYSNTSRLINEKNGGQLPSANPIIKHPDNRFKYDGVLPINTKSNLKNEINLDIPEYFNDLSNEYSFKYLDGDTEVMPKCLIEFYELDINDTPRSFILGVSSYYDELDENVIDINSNLNWSNLILIDSTKETSLNATIKDNRVYLLKSTYIDASKESCTEVINNIINTLE